MRTIGTAELQKLISLPSNEKLTKSPKDADGFSFLTRSLLALEYKK